MSSEDEHKPADRDNCVTHKHPVPAGEVARYSAVRDPDSEQEIARYVEIEAAGETVENVEKIKEEIILGNKYEVWDVATNQNKWWVITNLVNLYSQEYFPSLDYTITFHIGLMIRLQDRQTAGDRGDVEPFDEIFRRQQQAMYRHDSAIEAEDYQAVGLQLRESLISLMLAVRRRVEIDADVELPKDSDFTAWSALLASILTAKNNNKQLRQHIRNTSKETWQLVNWLTHDRNANQAASSICLHSCDTLVGHFIQLVVREKTDEIQICSICSSRQIRTHYDPTIHPDGDYYLTCGSCGWNGHPDKERK